MNLKQCISIMKKEVKNKFALSYIMSLDEIIEKDGMHGLFIQIKYIKENIKGWRGGSSTEVRRFLKEWIETKEKETYE